MVHDASYGTFTLAQVIRILGGDDVGAVLNSGRTAESILVSCVMAGMIAVGRLIWAQAAIRKLAANQALVRLSLGPPLDIIFLHLYMIPDLDTGHKGIGHSIW